MKKVLITGGLGFIGSNLAQELLSQNYKVSLLSKSKTKLKNISDLVPMPELILKDVHNISEDEVKDKEIIFHCASTNNNYHIHGEPFLDVNINCNGTISLLEACRKFNPSAKIVYLSTFFVNGKLDSLPATPESPCNPLGLYPATRLAGEHFCKIYNQVFGLNSVVARLTNVFGIKEQFDNKHKAAFNNLIKLAIDKQEIPLYDDGEFIRDYIYVSDVARGLITVAEKGVKGEVYYIGRGEKTKFKDLIDLVIKEARGGTIKPIAPPKFHNQVGIKDYYCDNQPIKNLGWTPSVSLEEGIKLTVDWYKKENGQ